jgi:IS5 family transposase
MHRVNRILTQTTKDKNRLYALHAPEVECISKGKARTPYEFGVEVTVATTLKEGFVVGTQSMPAPPTTGSPSKRPSSRSAFLQSKHRRL